ncbi:MAG: branched-chain amino acid ABC transporter permease [Deltaproteobacteria bacterium]|nr:MAG: branched-chain amino acid ABC transporter permease [Deltaproteobacteria bacterium]
MRGKSLIPFILGLALLLPLLGPGPYHLSLLNSALVITLLTLSWDLLGGVAGQVSLGQALFLGLGAYGFSLLSTYLPPAGAALATAVVGTAFAAFFGLFASRLEGIFFALFTLCSAEVFHEATMNIPFILKGVEVGGEGGVPCLGGAGILSLRGLVVEYYSLLLFTASVGWFLLRTLRHPVGLKLRGIAENELLARATGLPVERLKFGAFVASGVLGVVAGIFSALHSGRATPSDFSLELSFQAATLSALGGRGTVTGPALTAVAVSYLFGALDVPPQVRLSLYAILLPAILLDLPRKALGLLRGSRTPLSSRQ